MIPLRKQVRFNYQDYLHIPGDKRYEIIDGDLHMVPAPFTKHQLVSRNIETCLWSFVQKGDLGEVMNAPTDVILTQEDIVQPDILFISKKRLGILTEKNIQGAPDLVVEILSPSTKDWDLEIKKKLYEKHGVLEYWIVDTEAQSIAVFQFTEEGYRLVQNYISPSVLQSPLLAGFKMPLKEVMK